MQVQKTNSQRQPQRNSQNVGGRTRRAAANEHTPANAENTSPGRLGLHFLSDLKRMSLFEMAMTTGYLSNRMNQKDQWILDSVDTEEKQLQCIEDLYAIVKAQARYKKLKEPIFPANTPPAVVIQWLLRKISPLADGNYWEIDTWDDNGKTRYRFVVYKQYSRNDLSGGAWINCEFLPELKRRDEELHDMMVDVLALVSKNNNIPLWDRDEDFSNAVDWLLSAGVKSIANGLLEQHIALYSCGVAAQYLNLLRCRMREASIDDVRERLMKYKITSGRKRVAVDWVRDGLELAMGRKNLKPFTYVPNHLKGQPVTSFRMFKICWAKDGDTVSDKADQLFDEARDNGFYYPINFSITYPGKRVIPLKQEAPRFPIELFNFMNLGYKMLNHWYWQYYFGYKKRNQQDIALMDHIENNEIKVLING